MAATGGDKSSTTIIPVISGLAVGVALVVIFSFVFSSTGNAAGSKSVFDFQKTRSVNLGMDIRGMPNTVEIGAVLQPAVKIAGTVTGCAPPPYAEVRDIVSNEIVWNSGRTIVFCDPDAGHRSVDIDWTLGSGYVENGVYHPQPNKSAMVAEKTGRYELTIEYAGLKESRTFDVIIDTSQKTTQPVANIGCLPLSQVRGLKYDFKVPDYLPAGYEYKCGISESGEANVIFWNQTIYKKTYHVDPITSASTTRGAILLRLTDQPSVTNGTQSTIDQYNNILQVNPAIKPQLIDINGKLAWGNEIVPNGGVQTAKFPDGKVITNNYDMPARLKIFEQGKVTYLEGFVPLQELVKMAKSL
jgi:hypothetical protein